MRRGVFESFRGCWGFGCGLTLADLGVDFTGFMDASMSREKIKKVSN